MYHHSEVIDLCVHDYKVDHCLAYLFQSNTCQTVVFHLIVFSNNSRGVMVEIRDKKL